MGRNDKQAHWKMTDMVESCSFRADGYDQPFCSIRPLCARGLLLVVEFLPTASVLDLERGRQMG